VLWRYCDRLAALVDLASAGCVPKPPRGLVRALLQKPDASGACNNNGQVQIVGCSTFSAALLEPGRMSAAALKRTLHAVSAVESFLACSGRLKLPAELDWDSGHLQRSSGDRAVGTASTASRSNKSAEQQCHGAGTAAEAAPDASQATPSCPAPPPGWHLALVQLRAALEQSELHCRELQGNNVRLERELHTRSTQLERAPSTDTASTPSPPSSPLDPQAAEASAQVRPCSPHSRRARPY
jgi:hypothetical protein